MHIASMSYQLLKAQSITDHFGRQLSQLRTGRINSSILDHVEVETYGQKMKFNELATITAPEAGQLLITPFDLGNLQPMEKAINLSNLGVNPVNDGAGLRLNFPPLNQETREKRAKEVGVLLEEARISVRNDRQALIKLWKRQKEDGEITEDDLNDNESTLQEEVKNLNKDLEDMAEAKKKDLLTF